MANEHLKLGPNGLDALKCFEQFKPMPYDCGDGEHTVGYGHVIQPGEDYSQGICRTDALELLMRDVRHAESIVHRYVNVPLTQAQFDALALFAFNIGIRRFSQESTAIQRLNQGDYARCCTYMGLYGIMGGSAAAGLIIRRTAEQLIFLGSDWRKLLRDRADTYVA